MIRLVRNEDFDNWLEMRYELWSDCPLWEHKQEMRQWLDNLEDYPVFVALVNDKIVGFVEASIHEFSEGCHTRNIGFIEGWFVRSEYRKQGIGRALIDKVEEWAFEKGFKEVGSDAEIDNDVSLSAHLSLGYDLIGTNSQECKFLKEINVESILLNDYTAGVTYQGRKACYGIIRDNNKLAVIKTPKGYFLPGGGMEGLENFNQCIKRELLEETGYDCEVGDFLIKVTDYHITSDNTPYYTQAYFYNVKLLAKNQEKSEKDHELVWIDIAQARRELVPKLQRYVIVNYQK